MKVGVSLFIICSVAAGMAADTPIEVYKPFPQFTFERPVELRHPPDSDDLYVVEQAGKIYKLHPDNGRWQKTLFLDIRDRVNDTGNEEGLLGLAFHPRFFENGYFFLNYTADNPRRTKIVRMQAKRNKSTAATERLVLEFEQPYSNHNGGQLAFGPDGMLYIAVGDGGAVGDPMRHAQNKRTLLGALFRINVDSLPYTIPEDNPFAGNRNGYREEIYAYGLRNPWRFSFDPAGRIWAADVGQNRYEEINIIVSGGNYGWNIMEGNHCYIPAYNCSGRGLILPVFEYDHETGHSVTGGYFYSRGDLDRVKGTYVYGDFVEGKIWALRYENNRIVSNTLITREIPLIASFGLDRQGRIYVLSFDGNVYGFKAK